MSDADKTKRDLEIDTYLDDLAEIHLNIPQHLETANEDNRTADITA